MSKTPIKIAAVVFLVIGLVHVSRLVFHFNLVIGNWQVPVWVNAVAAVLAFTLSGWLVKTL